jgi:hypothetical protein
VTGRGRIPAAAPDRLASAVKKKKGRGGEGADRRGPVVSAAGKRKGKGGAVGRRGSELGRLGRMGGRGAFCFFFFSLFQTSFSNPFSTQIQIKLLQIFLKNLIDFLETTQAIKNHASQKMMHIHLLSLSLLNYL